MKRAKPKATTAELLAALPAAMWLHDQWINDTRARGFIPNGTTPEDLARVARLVVAALKKPQKPRGRR